MRRHIKSNVNGAISTAVMLMILAVTLEATGTTFFGVSLFPLILFIIAFALLASEWEDVKGLLILIRKAFK